MMNLRVLVGSLGSVLMAVSVPAQEPLAEEGSFRGGLVAGGNFSQVDGDRDGGVHKVGINAGLSSYVRLAPKVQLNLELLFAQKGSRYVREWYSTAGPYFMVYQMKLNYIEVPLLLHYNITSRWRGGIGIAYNRLIQSEERYRGLYGWYTFDPELYSFKKDEWEYVISAGFRLSSRMHAELRYQYSITPVREAPYIPEDFSGFKAQRNNLFALRIGYYL